MSNSIDLVKMASERQFSKFEDLAKDTLRTKIGENSDMKDLWSKLQFVKSTTISEGENPFAKKDDKDADKKPKDADGDGEEKDDDDEDGEDDNDSKKDGGDNGDDTKSKKD